MRETVCVKTICGIINKNSVYSQTGHIDCNVHDRHLNKRSKCRMTSTIMTRNGEISSAWWTREGVSVQFSSLHLVVSDSLQPHGLQYARLPCPSPTPGAYSDSCPMSQWCHQPSHHSPPTFSHSQHQGLSKWVPWVSSLHQVAKVLEFRLQHQSFTWIFRTDLL